MRMASTLVKKGLGNMNIQNKLVKRDKWLEAIRGEYTKASFMFAKFNSAHEGYAVILEELDEMWDEIKHKPKDWAHIKKEAVQVAAMALRFLVDLGEIET